MGWMRRPAEFRDGVGGLYRFGVLRFYGVATENETVIFPCEISAGAESK